MSVRSILFSCAVMTSSCAPRVTPFEDASTEPDIVSARRDARADAPPEGGSAPDGASDASAPADGSTPMDPACGARRPVVGRGAGAGADRCDGVAPPANGTGAAWCSLGSDVPGLLAPAGFCIRRFATVGLPRVMALAPNGDVFVASPSATTAAGHTGGRGEIVVLSDDNRDGTAEIHTFARGGLETVHGLEFSGGFLYFTTQEAVYRAPYARGQRAETPGSRQTVAGGAATPLGATFMRGGRWTHGLGASVNGRILATRGEYSACAVGPDGRPAPGIGEVYEVGMGALNRVASGFRNPMYARCHGCRDLCMVTEMGEDQTTGAVESFVVINNDHWYGYPCCYQSTTGPRASTGLCGCMDTQQIKINLGDSPFGFDWERGAWPAPWRSGVFIALHGSFYLPNYQGAGVMFLPTDPATGIPMNVPPTRFLEATNGSARVSLERPSDVRFSADGRMFLSDDKGGAVYWLAPVGWRM
jgi:glucose/arabinose dehydrogenase